MTRRFSNSRERGGVLIETAFMMTFLSLFFATLVDLALGYHELLILNHASRYAIRQTAAVTFDQVAEPTSLIPSSQTILRDFAIDQAEFALTEAGLDHEDYNIDLWSNESFAMSIASISISPKQQGIFSSLSGIILSRCVGTTAFLESRIAVPSSSPPENPDCNPGGF